MIHFNVPPFVGTEFTYMQEAVNTDLRSFDLFRK